MLTIRRSVKGEIMSLDFIKIRGIQDELEVYDSKIVITPKGILGFLNKGMKGSKEIPLSSITAIQFKKASFLTRGYIQFSVIGGNESRGGILSAVTDENTFIFNSKKNAEMEKVKIYLSERIGTNTKATSKTENESSFSDEILKLDNLKKNKSITEEEFKELKQKLIKKAS